MGRVFFNLLIYFKQLTDKYIEKLGGIRIYRLGEGNAGVDIDGDFDSWKSGVWSPLKANTKD